MKIVEVTEKAQLTEVIWAFPAIVALLQAGRVSLPYLIKRFGAKAVKQSQKELKKAQGGKPDNVVSFKGKNVVPKKTKAGNDNTKSPEQKMLDKLLEPRSADSIKFTRAVNQQKLDKFKATGDVSHLVGQNIPMSQIYQAAEAVRKGSGVETIKALSKLAAKLRGPKK